jgi:hypothetical protein
VGFDTALAFSPIFGPPLMVFFAILANTLLLTILISLLSNTFSTVAQNASEEAMYQHACKTLSGISSDAIMSYTPPLNLLAIVIIMPASFILTPRWLHKLNIALIRFTSWPLLLIIRLCSINSIKQTYLITGNTTSTSSRYMTTTAESASHLLSWMIPLPRSKANPDRDIIEAAFNHGKKKQLDEADWEEWTASMLDIREDDTHRNEDSAAAAVERAKEGTQSDDTKKASKTPVKKYGSTHSKQQQPIKVGQEGFSPETISNSSPLAKIYGRQPSQQHQRRSTSKDKQENEDDDSRFKSGIELAAEKNETHALIGQLMERMQQHEEAQIRIEKLLKQIINTSAKT